MADGTKVRNDLEELRDHFDIESVVSHYLSGKLAEWLSDRYYESEAEQVKELERNDPHLNAKLCRIIGVEAADSGESDVENLERINVKKAWLKQRTDNKEIIANANITALTQEDLADLLDMDVPVIYLCGERFNIPMSVRDKKYVGILGKPKVDIRASGEAELRNKNIVLENVVVPWSQSRNEKLHAARQRDYEPTFEPVYEEGPVRVYDEEKIREMRKVVKEYLRVNNVVNIMGKMQASLHFSGEGLKRLGSWASIGVDNSYLDTLSVDNGYNTRYVRLVCGENIDVENLVYFEAIEDYTYGYALTGDSFYYYTDDAGSTCVPYSEIQKFDKVRMEARDYLESVMHQDDVSFEVDGQVVDRSEMEGIFKQLFGGGHTHLQTDMPGADKAIGLFFKDGREVIKLPLRYAPVMQDAFIGMMKSLLRINRIF